MSTHPARIGRAAALVAVLMLSGGAAARASGIAPFGGHMSVGYGQLLISSAPGAALELTAMSGKPSPVRVGLQLGGRVGFVQGENWTILSARLSLLY